MRHNLTRIALVDLLKIINLVIGCKSLPETHYKFMKFCSTNFKYCKNFYCGNCNLFVGPIFTDELIKNFECSNCSSTQKKYFLSNSIENKLRDVIINNFKSIIEYKNKIQLKSLCDIVQGSFMKQFSNMNNFSISFNTDGVALFKSNLQKTFWPIIVTLNDLPPKLRYLKKNMIIAGLWCDKNISIEVFLKPFIKELVLMFEKGIKVYDVCYKIISSAVCVDSVARCKILKWKQFNGKYGCTYCKHPGDIVTIGGIFF